MVDETEEGKSQESLHVEWASADEDLLFVKSKKNAGQHPLRNFLSIHFLSSFSAHTWARTSPRAHPTREVHALAVKGFLSRASLYWAHPGTAPPRTTVGSRKRGLAEAVSLRKAGFLKAALLADGAGVTPKALTASQEVATRM